MRKIKPHVVNWDQIERFLASADKKLASAGKILAFDEEACLQLAYEAMLKASLGFMSAMDFAQEVNRDTILQSSILYVRAWTRNMLDC